MDDSSYRCRALKPCPLHHHHHHHHHHHPSLLCSHSSHHHHHHHHLSPNCPVHGFLFQPSNHSSACSLFTSPFLPQNPEPSASASSTNHLNLQVPEYKETSNFDALMMQEENVELEAEEEEEPVFVLTDEWREFFAKSEAKRRLAKKQAKQKVKN